MGSRLLLSIPVTWDFLLNLYFDDVTISDEYIAFNSRYLGFSVESEPILAYFID